MSLKPFWKYYGGKWRAAPRYPEPRFGTIVKPFAGAAGYSCRYWRRKVILVDRSPVICAIWRYLIGASAADIRALPLLEPGQSVDTLDVCDGARWLIGFHCNNGVAQPRKTLSAWACRDTPQHRMNGWRAIVRERIARQAACVSHWQLIEGDYTDAPDVEATWFIDPPYSTPAGARYKHQPESFDDLGEWCQTRRGQVVVCEQAGADWLPFTPFGECKSTLGSSSEVIWTSGCGPRQAVLT